MPFLAECPYCRTGKVRVPDGAVGWSVQCPNPDCGSAFTVSPPPKQTSATSRIAAAATAKPPPPAPSTPAIKPETPAAPALAPETVLGDISEEPEAAVETAEEAESDRTAADVSGVPASSIRPFMIDPWKPTQRMNNPAVLGLFFGAAALLTASLPGVHVASIPLAGIGLLFALLGILYAIGRERGMVVAVLAAALNGLMLILMIVAPWLLNMQLAFEGNGEESDLPKLASSPTTGRGEARTLDESEWVDATSTAIHRQDVWVKVQSARIERVGFEVQGRRQLSDRPYLVIRIQLANVGVERPVEYKSWRQFQSGSGSERVTLRDSSGRTLGAAGLPSGTQLVGAVREARIFPDKSHDDFLVFEPPGNDFQFLDLQLPGQAVGVEGDFRFRIPRSMVRGM
ncbi:MAG: hypothetical protein NZM31_08575 [Gemmatales bacterium]|nr:hypothetical protein [Gemmatales bacterium]MDW8387046.1 hypothetical protein [Gemmatales bacterium]